MTRTLPALLLVGLLAGGLSAGTSAPPAQTDEGYEQVVRPLLLEHGCRPVSFGEIEGEQAALIRTPAGRLRVVPLARGRAVYAGRRPGTLVGVCTRAERLAGESPSRFRR